MTADNSLDGEERDAHEQAYRPSMERDQQLNLFDSVRIQTENPSSR